MRIFYKLFLLTLIILSFSCVSFEDKANNFIKNQLYLNTLQIILDQADILIGKKPYEVVKVHNKTFKLDCIGTVSAIFYSAKIDIRKYFKKYKGNGVSRFYYTLKDIKTLHKENIPEVGDVIFWDNTWDRNEDKVIGNDPLTHTAVVVKIDDDGTIHYVHLNYVYGVVVEQMNLLNPTVYKDKNGKEINSPMYINSSLKKHPEHWLSGDLFKHFGGVLKVKKYFFN
jgi:hypothetical protein